MARRIRNRFYLYVSVALSLAIVAYSYNLSLKSEDGLIYDGASLDLAIKYRFAAPPASDNIVIIDIDERSLADLSADYGRWPWPRDVVAELLLALEDQGAASIALNVMFSDQDINNPEADELLNAVACELEKTTFPMTRLAQQNDELSDIRLSMIPGALKTADAIDQKIALLLPFFPCAQNKMALNNLVVDDDGVVRRAKEYWSESGYLLPSIAGRAKTWSPEMAKATADQSAFLINWRNKSGKGYHRVPFSDLYRNLVRGEEASQPLPLIKGNHFVIGASAPGIAVLKGTSLGPTTDDNEIIATMIDDLNSGTGLTPIDIWLNAAISCAFVLVLSLLFGRGLDEDAADVFFVVLEFAAIVVTIISVSYFHVIVDLSAPAAAGVILFSVVKIHQYAERNSRKGMGLFGPKPDHSSVVRVVQLSTADEVALNRLESHFGLKNVIEVDQLVQDSNILSDVLEDSRYLFIFSDLDAWATLQARSANATEGYVLIGETHWAAETEDEQTEWRLLMARLASICLDHYATSFTRTDSG